MFNVEDGNLKTRQKCTAHRQGVMIKFFDTIQALINIKQDNKLIKFKKPHDPNDMGSYNHEVIDKMFNILDELKMFDITEIGDLYFTSGGRIVIDRGYGEYFNSGDTKIMEKHELMSGIEYDSFLQKIILLKHKNVVDFFLKEHKGIYTKKEEKMIRDKIKAYKMIKEI